MEILLLNILKSCAAVRELFFYIESLAKFLVEPAES